MSNRTDIVVETDNAEGQVLLSASRVYDLTEDKTQDIINSEVRNTLNKLVIQPNARITVPTGSTGVTKSIAGITTDHVLIKWNFYTASTGGSVIAENSPPQDMEWSTGNGTFTIKTGGSSTVYCQPVFALPELLSAT